MSSGDISVFWQEIIDTYRDIMVVKSTDSARSYLDLTDVEYATLKNIASLFTMARLSYHTTLLESALSDMQMATNSKRSIAEIALTRMCDAKLVVSAEALAVRVEELEKQLAMLKMGVPAAVKQSEEKKPCAVVEKSDEPIKAKIESDSKPLDKKAEVSSENTSSSPVPYEKWRAAVERIGELKRSLASQFASSRAYRMPSGEFVVTMNEFFAARISANAADFAILRGVIAELEGKTSDAVSVRIKVSKPDAASDPAGELESLINQ